MLGSSVSPFSQVIAWSCVALEVLLLAGLIVRRRVSHSYALAALVVAWLTSALIVGICPSCLTWRTWLFSELVHALLAFLVAVELAYRGFRQVPRAWWWAKTALLATAVLGAGLVYLAQPSALSIGLVPWLLGALACLYMALWLVALAVALPQERLHTATLTALSPYLIVYAVTWGQVQADTRMANLVNPLMFTAALALLVRAAWSRETMAPKGHPETVQWLFPWRY